MATFSSVEGMPSHLISDSGRRLGYQVRRRKQQRSCIDFKYAIPLVVELLTLKYQGKDQNPFEAHPLLITISILSMLLSFLAASVKLPRLSRNSKRILRHTRDLPGALALALLGSLLLSHSLFWSTYLVCLSLWWSSLFNLLKCLQRWLSQTATIMQSTITKLNHLITIHTRTDDPELPTPPIPV